MNKGLERPFRLEPERKAHLQLIVEDTIATLYLDGVALNTRMYHKAGQALALYVVDGALTVESARLERGLKERG
jgi:beta-fructofuranosidase